MDNAANRTFCSTAAVVAVSAVKSHYQAEAVLRGLYYFQSTQPSRFVRLAKRKRDLLPLTSATIASLRTFAQMLF